MPWREEEGLSLHIRVLTIDVWNAKGTQRDMVFSE